MMKTNEFIIMKIILYYIKKTVTLVVVCGMVMHSMVIILTIKTRQKKVIFFHWRCSAVFIFHFSVCSIAVPVANGVAKLACLLSCLPPEQYIVAVWQNRDVKNNKSIQFTAYKCMNLWLQVFSDMIMVFCIVYPNKADLQMWCNVLLWPPVSLHPPLLTCSSSPSLQTHGSDAFRARGGFQTNDRKSRIQTSSAAGCGGPQRPLVKKDVNKLTNTSLMQK